MSNIEDNEGLESLERSLTLNLDHQYDEGSSGSMRHGQGV